MNESYLELPVVTIDPRLSDVEYIGARVEENPCWVVAAPQEPTDEMMGEILREINSDPAPWIIYRMKGRVESSKCYERLEGVSFWMHPGATAV